MNFSGKALSKSVMENENPQVSSCCAAPLVLARDERGLECSHCGLPEEWTEDGFEETDADAAE